MALDLLAALDTAQASADEARAREALDGLCAKLLPADPEELDELSFDLFGPLMQAAAEPAAERLLLAVAEVASAREVVCLVMEAFGVHCTPTAQLLLERALAASLPRIARKREAFVETCLGSLYARFLRECVADLQSNLRLIGSDLLVVVGKPEEVIAPLVLGDGKTTVVLTQVRSRHVYAYTENRKRGKRLSRETDLLEPKDRRWVSFCFLRRAARRP